MSLYDLLRDVEEGTGRKANNGSNGLLYSALARLNRDDTRDVSSGGADGGASTYPMLSQDQRVKTLLDFIAGPESGGNYNAVYGNAGASNDLSQNTLGEVISDARYRGGKTGSSATGRYQMLADTMSGVAKNAGIPLDAKFTPELQDYMATQLLKEKGLEDYMDGSLSPAQFGSNIADVWAGLPKGPDGKSAYEGDSMGNHAGVSYPAMMAALGGSSQPSQGAMPAAFQQDAAIPAALQGQGQSQVEPNFWDKLMAVRAHGGGGLSSLLIAGLGTGAGWAPGMEDAGSSGQIDPYKLAQIRTERLRGDKLVSDMNVAGSPKPMTPLDQAKLATEQLRAKQLEAQIGQVGRGEQAQMQKQEYARQQAGAEYQAASDALDATEAKVKQAWGAVGGRGAGKRWDRFTADLPGIGSDSDQADLYTLKASAVQGMLDTAASKMKGSYSEGEWKMLRETVPTPSDSWDTWQRYFDRLRTFLKQSADSAMVGDSGSGGTGTGSAPTAGGGISQYYH